MFFSERFLAARPLLESIRSPDPTVLLIDEVDRADEALEAVLLETLAEFQVSVPEVGTFTTEIPPYVILTSNNTRDLSAALKRRCLHLFLDYPSAERELEIIRSKHTGLPEALAKQLIDIVRGLRELELRKSPSISETIDWARTLAVLGVQELNATVLADTASVVVKYDKDVRKAIAALPRLVDPNATVPETGTATDTDTATATAPPPTPTTPTTRRPGRSASAGGEGPGGPARRGHLRQPAAIGAAGRRGRLRADGARRHLGPGQPVVRAGAQARLVNVAAGRSHRSTVVRAREETRWRAVGTGSKRSRRRSAGRRSACPGPSTWLWSRARSRESP